MQGNENFLNCNYTEAIYCYNQATQLNLDIKEYWYNRGLALCSLGSSEDLKSAIDSFNQALIIEPDYSDAQASKDKARQALQKILKTSS